MLRLSVSPDRGPPGPLILIYAPSSKHMRRAWWPAVRQDNEPVLSGYALARARAFDGDGLAGSGVELQPLHMVEVAAGDAHEAAALGIVDGVDGAHVIDAGTAGLETIALDLLEPGFAGAVAAVEAPVLAHVGVLDRLPIDRPRAAVIMRRAFVRLRIAVRQHDEAQVLVLVELARADRRGRADRLVDERAVAQQLLQQHAHLLAAGRAAGGLEGRLGVLDESVERVGHEALRRCRR